jgi:hypothetical protein
MSLEPKDLYDAVGNNLRYYLDWRARLLTGYLTAIVGLAIAFSWAVAHHPRVAFLIPIVAAGLTVVIWLLDWRNRDAYRDCIAAGAALERTIAITDGMYGRFEVNSSRTRIAHSRTLNWMFGVSAACFLVAAVYLFWMDGQLP